MNLATLPTTNTRIAVSLALCVVFVITALAADIAGHAITETTLSTLAFFLLGMLGADVASFGIKRFSDRDYAAAKASGPSPVNVEGPSSVSVTPTANEES